jgi:hypothetical protein
MKLQTAFADTTPGKIGVSTDRFKIIKDGTDGNKYKYLKDGVNNQDKFSLKPTDLKTMYDTTKLVIPTTFTTLDDGTNNPLAETNAASGGINTLKNITEYDIKKDITTGKDRDPTVNEIQTRLNNCYTLELLYMRKHEELLKISRILNFDTNDEVSFIIYNKNFEILWKGSSSQNNINFNEADKIFFEYQSDVTPKQKEKRVDVFAK